MIIILHRFVVLVSIILANVAIVSADEPPAINPFGQATADREDAVPGYVELSDGSIHPGQISLTRDKRLEISDKQSERQREFPLNAVKQIDCAIIKQWMEKEWKFKELTQDEKMYTGRSYPVREYVHTITLKDGRTITGGLSAIVYVQSRNDDTTKSAESQPKTKTTQFILNKRNKGEIGEELNSLVYMKSIKLGKEAFDEGKQKAIHFGKQKSENKLGK